MRLDNEFKIRFCNTYSAIVVHNMKCPQCETYLELGSGDLCDKGKDIIAEHMAYADTRIDLKDLDKNG